MAAPEQFKGYECTVCTDSLGGTSIGCVQEFSLSISNNLEALYCLGARTPSSLKEGNQAITGSVSMAMVDTTFPLTCVPASAALQSDDDLYVQLDDGTNDTIDITLADLKWGDFTFSVSSDGSTVIESGTFIAKAVTFASS